MSWKPVAAWLAAGVIVTGCGSGDTRTAPPAKLRRAGGGIPPSLLAGERTIGRGPRFEPPARGDVHGTCRTPLGAREATHVELFGDDHVVLIAAGIGTRPPRRAVGGRILEARCFGTLVTLDPTGTVYVTPGSQATLADLFRTWGQSLSARRVASFTGGRVRVYVDGRALAGSPLSVPLARHAEIVVEVGPYVPPHHGYVFPPDPPAGTR